MSWTSLDDNDATSSSDAEDLAVPANTEPNSDNEINSRKDGLSQRELQNLLTSKDERIHNLQKLINGQREQLYHYLNMSLKEETLLELKKTCRETEALNRNENICMALDKFKYDNNLPTEQTLVREDVSRTLLKIERLMRHQVKLIKTMELGGVNEKLEEAEESIEISCFQSVAEFTDVQKLFKSTKQIQRKMQILKIQLKKLALIEQERIDLVERVYSMPPDQRQYYAHLAAIEGEKIQLRSEIDELMENYRNLKQKCRLLEETEKELNKCIDTKIAGLDLNKIKPGLETHLELMEMVERGELSLITMTKDEKGKFTDDFIKLYNENAEISERLKDFDNVTQQRDDLKRQIEVLVENCLRLQSEVKALRLASKTDDLLEQLRQACLEREQLKTKLERLTKRDSGVLRIHDETAEKISEERDQLRLKLVDHLTIQEELKSLRFKVSQSEAYRIEAERLKSELEEVRIAHIALLDKSSGRNLDIVSPPDRDVNRNMSEQLEHMNELEKQRERLVLEVSRYKYALLKQEEEIKDLVITVDKLIEQLKTLRPNGTVNHAEGIPEGPEVNNTCALNSKEVKRLEIIRNRIAYSSASSTEVPSKNNTFLTSFKSFLGLDKSLVKKIH